MKTKKTESTGIHILGLDTSSRMLTVACAEASGLVSEADLYGELQHSEKFFNLMESVLSSLSLELKDVDAFAIGLGPGSFTGLRIGFSVLKGLLAAHERPVYGISSLDLIADGISLDSGRLAVLMNARRERIYAAFYHFSAGRWERETPEDEVLSPEELTSRSNGEIYFTGDALKEYGDLIRKKMPKAVFFQENFWYPHADRLVNLVRSRYTQMKPLDRGSFKPAYLRLSEAEEKKLGNLYSPTARG